MSGRARRVLILSPTLPEADREGGSRDLADLVDFLRAAGWTVQFTACTNQPDERHAARLRRLGVAVTITADLEPALFEGEAPELVVVAFWHLAERALPAIRRAWPDTPVIVSSIDLHFVRAARRIFGAVARGSRSFLLDRFYADELIREVNTYACADGVFAVSAKEAQLISDLTGEPGLASWVPVTKGEDRGPLDFGARRGILFVGNFRHEPNVEAVEHLCREVVPRLDPALLAEHPVTIVGNAPDQRVRRAVLSTPGVVLVGWVPSLTPYLHAARVSVVPVRYGAGVKGKLIRALAAGTPAVSTTVGIEGLDLVPGEDVLVADDAAAMAASLTQLLTDHVLWSRVADAGHDRIGLTHSAEAVRTRLFAAIDRVLARPPKGSAVAEQLESGRPETRYEEAVHSLRIVAHRRLDPSVPIAVVSKGDPALVAIGGFEAEHFPQDDQGRYLGWHPPDGADVCRRLDGLRARGRHYLAIPQVSHWWLDHYAGLADYLDEHYQLLVREDDVCLVWEHVPAASEASTSAASVAPVAPAVPRPEIVVPVEEGSRPRISHAPPPSAARRASVLVLGVYLADRPTHADDVVQVTGAARACAVDQRWVALGGDPPTRALADATARVQREPRPKFAIVNDLLAAQPVEDYDYVVLVDDDLGLPHGFLDGLIGWQRELGWALAQPARTAGSFIDHRIVQQQPGVAARRTRFVEIGPVVSIHKSAFELLLPFDLASPMGWGYENVWSHRLERAGLRMGIVDAVPVDHRLRPPVANYSWDEADAASRRFLAANEHLPLDACFQVLEVVGGDGRHAA